MIDDKTMNYLAGVSIFIDFYKDGYLTDEEYKAMEEKIAKKCGINTIWVNSKKIVQNNIRTVSVDDIRKINENLIESLDKDFER